MNDTHHNPLGIDGFEFVEFAAPDPALLHGLFRRMGFTAVARHRGRQITLYRQGDINFLVNEEPDSFAGGFSRDHGPCACGFAIRVADAGKARERALENGADELPDPAEGLAVDTPAIQGIGGSILYLVDQFLPN